MFPPVNRKWQPEYTDFNYWRPSLPDVPLPDLTPVSPALSATSDSSRLGLLRNMASGIARRASRQTITSEGSKDGGVPSQTSRPTSPLVGPSIVAGDYDSVSEAEGDVLHDQTSSMPGSLPGSFVGVGITSTMSSLISGIGRRRRTGRGGEEIVRSTWARVMMMMKTRGMTTMSGSGFRRTMWIQRCLMMICWRRVRCQRFRSSSTMGR